MKYRNRTDISAQIVESAAAGGMTKTKLMYMAYVPHEQMPELLSELVRNELISFDQQTHLYRTTSKGKRFLLNYNKLRACLCSPQYMQVHE